MTQTAVVFGLLKDIFMDIFKGMAVGAVSLFEFIDSSREVRSSKRILINIWLVVSQVTAVETVHLLASLASKSCFFVGLFEETRNETLILDINIQTVEASLFLIFFRQLDVLELSLMGSLA